ncbi:putative sporulation-specific protein 2 [Venustampulla echinocandica]|uniref:Putative sporulation-specific protein 2 n=1 Tax=Venustampulla echinocandica TaxID=2656787 RepID=A0A370TQM3_9HELO|nr:putative sporulation-specific protein 2 [Venustampulla echinocandica]RDL37808.1 putative sporulation-specific protein 2 [Venustampulla echinocandica]
MFAKQILLPALAAWSVSAANICSETTITLNSAADAAALASCSTIAGSIVLSSTVSGVVSIDGPQQIKGDIVCEDAGQLTSLGSSSIGTIGGTFRLTNLTLLSTLSMSDLTSVKALEWTALPALSQLTFPSVLSKANAVLITNTFLSTLDGINLQTVGTLNINNNNRLKTFSTQVANITQLVDISSNGQNLDVSFPNLIWAANATFRNVSSIKLPSLATVNGSLGFYGTNSESIIAPNLTTVGDITKSASVGGSLALVANSALSNISFPVLKSVAGAVQVANNTALSAISFPALETVNGAIDFAGNFSTPELPEIKDVKGGFNVQSTVKIDCSNFESMKNKIIQGTFTCKTTADAKSGVGSSTGTSSSDSPTSSKKSDAGSFGVSEAVAGFSVLGGLLQMLL